MPIDSFDHKILLIVRNQEEGKQLNLIFNSVGMKECEPEVLETNVVVRLQDRSYVGCIINYDASKNLTARIISGLRENNVTAQIPVVVLAQNQDLDTIRTLYDAGANYVVRKNIVEEAMDVAWIINSLIKYASAFKVGRERFNR